MPALEAGIAVAVLAGFEEAVEGTLHSPNGVLKRVRMDLLQPRIRVLEMRQVAGLVVEIRGDVAILPQHFAVFDAPIIDVSTGLKHRHKTSLLRLRRAEPTLVRLSHTSPLGLKSRGLRRASGQCFATTAGSPCVQEGPQANSGNHPIAPKKTPHP